MEKVEKQLKYLLPSRGSSCIASITSKGISCSLGVSRSPNSSSSKGVGKELEGKKLFQGYQCPAKYPGY